jgi:hypothetical protein
MSVMAMLRQPRADARRARDLEDCEVNLMAAHLPPEVSCFVEDQTDFRAFSVQVAERTSYGVISNTDPKILEPSPAVVP